MSEHAKIGDWVRSKVNYRGIREGEVYEVIHPMSDGRGVHVVFENYAECLYHEEYEIASPPDRFGVNRDIALNDRPKLHPDSTTALDELGEMIGLDMTTHPTGAVRETKTGKGKQHYLMVGFPYTLTELAKHMENPLGRNWEEGLPVSSYADAAIRHLIGFLSGDPEPHHLRAAIWNMMCLSETVHRVEVETLPEEVDDVDRTRKSWMNGSEG